jgi:ABC-2 type transport system permease protein
MSSRKLLAIIRNELNHYFSSPVGYAVLLVYFFLGGGFFYLGMVNQREASMRQIFGTLTFILLFVTPLVTMRLWAEEEKNGTAELLKTSPLTLWEIIIGKYLGVCSFYIVMSIPTLVYLLIISIMGNPDFPPLLANYLGYLLVGMLFLSFGLFASTLTENQIVAAIISLGLNLFLWVIGAFVGNNMDNKFGDFLKYISIYNHSDDFLKGIIDLTHVFYFVSFIFVGLFFSVKILESKRS